MLLDNASRMLIELRGSLSRSTCVLEAKPGKLDIKGRESGILKTLTTLRCDIRVTVCHHFYITMTARINVRQVLGQRVAFHFLFIFSTG